MAPTNKKPLLIAVSVVLVVLIAAGVFIARPGKHHVNLKPKTSTATPSSPAATNAYHYKSLDAYSVGAGGAGLTFSKPTEFKPLDKPAANATQDLLVHLPTPRIVPDYGQIAVLSFPFTPTADTISGLNAKLTDAKSPGHQITADGFKSFMNPRLPITYKVSELNVFTAFTSPNIKTNAWVSDFTAISSDAKSPKLKGKFIVLTGAKNQYFFMVENVESTWTANQSIWQQVINSIEIDQ
jgi:hypothetical protein